MRNILLILGEILICYSSMVLLFKKYKTDGIYIYSIIAIIASCLACLNKISIMEISIPVGFCLTTSLVINGNILIEQNKKEELRNYLGIIFLTAIISVTILNLSGLIINSDFNVYSNESYNSIFSYNIKIYIALIVSIIGATIISSKIYNTLRKKSNKIVVSNIFSIIISTLFENILFILIAYLSDFEILDLIICLIFRYIIKTLIGIIGTIPLCIIGKEN